MKRVHWVAFPLALLPLALGALSAWVEFRHELEGERLGAAIPILVPLVWSRVLSFALPTLLLWLALGVDIKRRARFDARGFLSGSARQLAVALRDWAPLLLVLSGYAWMSAVIDLGGSGGRDGWMQAADRFLFAGRDPLDLVERIIWLPLTEWMAFSYSFYAVMFPLVIGGAFMFGGRKALSQASFAIGSMLLVAYLCYTVIPVKGPLLVRSFAVPLDTYLIGNAKEAMMDATRITWDCFPSMHTGCTVVLSFFAWRYTRRLFWFTLPMAATIPVACVYLRYHYVVDVLAGLLVAALAVLATRALRAWL